MPTMITDECVNCGACLLSCPNDGISKGQHKVLLDATLCTECVGFFSSERCAAVCPIEGACVADPDNVETEEALFARAVRIHARAPKPPILSPKTSHFLAADAPSWWQRWVPSLTNPRRAVAEVEDA